MSISSNKALVLRYYEHLWNCWDLGLAKEIVAKHITFRGSLGIAVDGLDQFTGYMNTVREAFPDFHNRVEELIGEDDRIVARLTYSGTHQGELFGIPPTGRHVTYSGVALFRISDNKIAEGWVLGDLHALMQQLSWSSL